MRDSKLDKFVFDEMAVMNKLEFNYQTKIEPFSLAPLIAWRMNSLVIRGIGMEYLLYYPYFLEEFNESDIQ